MKTVIGIAIAFCIVSSTSGMGFMKMSTTLNTGPSESLFSVLETNNVLANFFDKENSIETFMNQTFKNLFNQLDEVKMRNKITHPDEPDKKTKRVILLTALAQTKRNLRGAFDIRRFVENSNDLLQNEQYCDDDKKCPYLDLLAKQFGRAVENLNDEINFWNDVNKDGKCEYLSLKVTLLGRVVDILNRRIQWINDNNGKQLDGMSKKDLALANIDDIIKNQQDAIAFLQRQLSKLRQEDKVQVRGACPYLDLRIRLQARKVANDSSTLILLQWLNRKKRDAVDNMKVEEKPFQKQEDISSCGFFMLKGI